MENKQTAVDFLLHELSEILGVIAPDAFSAGLMKIKYDQAKAMEKKEHERIADKAREDGWRDAKYGGQRW